MINKAQLLAKISQKALRRVIGIMSGTSVDGLNMAICDFSGFGKNTKFDLVHFQSTDMPENLRQSILQLRGKKWIDFQELTILNEEFAIFTANEVKNMLAKLKMDAAEIDFIASHGQTLFHAPQSLHNNLTRPNATLQIGDGDHIAVLTGILTISDFRQKHIAYGGEGAPLALFGDFALFSSQVEHRILLNVGGISNFTFLPKSPRTDCWATDVGPGNTIMDELCRKHFYTNYDDGGDMARSGKCHDPLLSKLLTHAYFQLSSPKTTGQEAFSLDWFEEVAKEFSGLSSQDLLATATHLTAVSIANDIQRLHIAEPISVYISGGGSKNIFLKDLLRSKLERNCSLFDFESLGVSGEAKEAIIFGFLGNENFSSNHLIYPFAMPPFNMGKFSFPN